MSKFKHGDRVTIGGLHGSNPIVVGDSPVNSKKVIVECHPTGGEPYTMVCYEDQLRLARTRPDIKYPWAIFNVDGVLVSSLSSKEIAVRRARGGRGVAIVDVRTGEWYDTEGERIP